MEEVNLNIPQNNNKKTERVSNTNKLSDFEKSFDRMQLHLNFLSKQEQIEDIKLKTLYNTSIQVANNKINHVTTHLCVSIFPIKRKQIEGNRMSQHKMKKSVVKEMREKEINQLRETRLEMSQMKEKQKRELKDYCKQNEKMLRNLRLEEKIQNLKKAEKIKTEQKENKRRQAIERIQKKKYHDELLLQRQEEEQRRQRNLRDHLENLKREEEKIEDRIKQKKSIQLKMKETIQGIPSLEEQMILDLTGISRKGKRTGRYRSTEQRVYLDQKNIVQKAMKRASILEQ